MISAWRGRKRRPDDGRYLPKDEATWRRLIRWARKGSRDLRRHGLNLAAAAGAAARAVPPPGHATRESVFLQLVVKGRLAWPVSPLSAPELAPKLAELADACEAALEQQAGRAARERKDLEG